MKMKTFALLLGLLTLVSACAGEKNEASTNDTVLAVRNFEGQNGQSGEAEVAVINAKDPKEAEANAQNATYIPLSRFDNENSVVNFRNVEDGGDKQNASVVVGGGCGPNGCIGGGVRTNWAGRGWVNTAPNFITTGGCGMNYIWFAGSCVVPFTPVVAVAWRPVYAFPCTFPVVTTRTTITTRSYVRIFGSW